MAETSNMNPEIFFNFEPTPAMELKQSAASLCASAFHPECLGMVEVTDEKAYDINARNTRTHDAENLFLKFSWLINNVYSRKSIINQMITLDHIFQILVDATDNDSITVFYYDGSTNLSFIFGGTSRSDDSIISRTSSSIRSPPVWKIADAPGNGATVHPNVENEDGGNEGGNGNGNGVNNDGNNNAFGGTNGNANGDSDDGYGGNDSGSWIDGITALEPIKIHRIDVDVNNWNIVYRPTLNTSMYAFRYGSWQVLSEAVYRIWLQRNGDNNASANGHAPEIAGPMNPNNCWPGAVTKFGRYEGGCFYQIHWVEHSLRAVEVLVRDVLVVRPIYLQHGN